MIQKYLWENIFKTVTRKGLPIVAIYQLPSNSLGENSWYNLHKQKKLSFQTALFVNRERITGLGSIQSHSLSI